MRNLHHQTQYSVKLELPRAQLSYITITRCFRHTDSTTRTLARPLTRDSAHSDGLDQVARDQLQHEALHQLLLHLEPPEGGQETISKFRLCALILYFSSLRMST
jgi:hypothetical protein